MREIKRERERGRGEREKKEKRGLALSVPHSVSMRDYYINFDINSPMEKCFFVIIESTTDKVGIQI